MAPLPSNTTDRLKCHYTGPLGSHDALFRAPEGESTAGLIEDARTAITAIVEAQYDGTAWDGAEFSAAGSDLFFPVPDWDPIISDTGVNPGANSGAARFIQFGGRSSGGRRVKLYIYETTADNTGDYRFAPGESASVDAIIAALGGESSELCAIDGLTTTWYTYANVGENDHAVHKARRS